MIKKTLLQPITVISLTDKASTSTNLSITLRSEDAIRAIELSTDDGQEFFLAGYDVETSTMLMLSVTTPITHVKITALVDDTVVILGEV